MLRLQVTTHNSGVLSGLKEGCMESEQGQRSTKWDPPTRGCGPIVPRAICSRGTVCRVFQGWTCFQASGGMAFSIVAILFPTNVRYVLGFSSSHASTIVLSHHANTVLMGISRAVLTLVSSLESSVAPQSSSLGMVKGKGSYTLSWKRLRTSVSSRVPFQPQSFRMSGILTVSNILHWELFPE